jgi:hypothetical protein
MTLDFAQAQPNQTPEVHNAWTVGHVSAWSHPIALPIRPYLPGLLLNTLFYAFLFTIPLTLKRLRRRLRLRRGHCPHCNYDLLHNFTHPCPECGRTGRLTAEAQRAQR